MIRMLVVENDPDTVELLQDLFPSPRYRIDATPNGVQGLQKAAAHRYDLVILDLGVEEIGGLVVQKAVRDFSDVPTVVMSARAGTWSDEALRAGATACISKPFGAGGLARLVEAIVSKGGRKGGWPGDVQSLDAKDLARLKRLSRRRLDALPFGAIRLDADGRIVAFNAYEAEAAREDARKVLGMRFAGLAPCTKVKSFMGILDRARAGEGVDEVLRFVFPRHGALALVNIRIHADSPDSVWLFVSQRKS